MKNPTITDILNHYLVSNQCTIQLRNKQVIIGTFTNGPYRESNVIVGWYFHPKHEKEPIIIRHDQIAEIEKNF